MVFQQATRIHVAPKTKSWAAIFVSAFAFVCSFEVRAAENITSLCEYYDHYNSIANVQPENIYKGSFSANWRNKAQPLNLVYDLNEEAKVFYMVPSIAFPVAAFSDTSAGNNDQKTILTIVYSNRQNCSKPFL